MPTPARGAAFDILLRVEKQSSYAAELLHGPLTADLSERDAALCTELVMGALRWQRTLDFIAQSLATGNWERFDPEVRVALRLGLYQLRFLTRVPAHAAVDESVELVKGSGKASAAALVNAVLRKGGEVALSSLRPSNMADSEWKAIEISHPAWMFDRWSRRFGAETAMALAQADNQTPKTYLRLNTAPLDSAQITEQLLVEGIEVRPGKFLKTSIAVASDLAGSSTCPATVSAAVSLATRPARYWAAELARNQTAIKVEIRAAGASLVISDRPTGERQSSPVVCSR